MVCTSNSGQSVPVTLVYLYQQQCQYKYQRKLQYLYQFQCVVSVCNSGPCMCSNTWIGVFQAGTVQSGCTNWCTNTPGWENTLLLVTTHIYMLGKHRVHDMMQ